MENISYQDKINDEIQIEKIKASNKILWKVFLNTKLHLEISLTRSKIEKYFFGIKYFEIFTFSSWMRRYWFYVKNDFRNFHQIFTF